MLPLLVTYYRSSLTLAKKSDRLLFGCYFFEMTVFLILVLFLAFEPERLDRLRFIRFCRLIRSVNEPPVCFLTVFEIVFFNDCFADFCCWQHPLTLVHFVREVFFRHVLLRVEWISVQTVRRFDLCHFLKFQSRFLFAYSVQKNKATKMLDWYSTFPLF